MSLQECLEVAQQLGGQVRSVTATGFVVVFPDPAMSTMFIQLVSGSGGFLLSAYGTSVTVSVG